MWVLSDFKAGGVRTTLRFLLIVCTLCIAEKADCFSLLPYYELDGFSGKVVDLDTDEPIQWAVVLVVYHKEVPTIAGSSWHPVDCREAVTDVNGEFDIQKKRLWFYEKWGHPRGQVNIFKPGYGNLWHKRSVAKGVNISWPPPDQYVVYKLPRLVTLKERKQNLPWPPRLPRTLWPNYLRIINKERLNLGYAPLPSLDATEQRPTRLPEIYVPSYSSDGNTEGIVPLGDQHLQRTGKKLHSE